MIDGLINSAPKILDRFSPILVIFFFFNSIECHGYLLVWLLVRRKNGREEKCESRESHVRKYMCKEYMHIYREMKILLKKEKGVGVVFFFFLSDFNI